MLLEGMYVRCPADIEDMINPRVFICAQIQKVDNFKRTMKVKIHDPFNHLLFFEHLPQGIIEVPMNSADHCSLFVGSEVIHNDEICKVLSSKKITNGYYYYYVQSNSSKTIFRVSEKEIIASFTNGKVDPTVQLRNYEFQNPVWFMGHSIVSRSMNILENSIYGFKELAGCKIYLLPHQINTIMRCIQEEPCRYMLADEVGMGKTIEAISILKIFMQNQSDSKVLIIVPETLKEQWKTELMLKFNINIGTNINNNKVTIKTTRELTSNDTSTKWNYVIVDEVHRYLDSKLNYDKLYNISTNSDNILLLSATPVQQRREEYYDLLRLLLPQKYNQYDIGQFSSLIGKQSRIIQMTALILDDLGDYEEEIANVLDVNEDPHESEDCVELFEEIYEELYKICYELDDAKLKHVFEKIQFDDKDLGVYNIKLLISYICSYYQIESNIIRNRRKLLEDYDGERLLPTRELSTITYKLDPDKNVYEFICYQYLSEWISSNAKGLDVESAIRPILSSFFSSPWAFKAQIILLKNKGFKFDDTLNNNLTNWIGFEQYIIDNIKDILDDPYSNEDYYSTRLLSVINLIFDDLYDKKIVLFTNYSETFEVYREVLNTVFDKNEISFFGAKMPISEIEMFSYRFQNEPSCRIMLCDYTGGEGRNFQCADYVIHIDIPWDANNIEQRIGRLDRLERDITRPTVYSVAIHTEETFESALFDFWSKGLKIFTQSLSGMEIIMKDINQEIVTAIKEDFRYGLFEKIPKIIELADTMRETVRKEQNYDVAGLMFRPMYSELKRLINYYTQFENDLFANSMTNWANLAGFRGFKSSEGIITYTADSFSPKSALNSQLIPPYWNSYLNRKQNKFINDVQHEYDKSKAIKTQDRSIRGTFLRKLAIENDYLHFFAPGDDIFDCIVNNAINSTKGKASAFASLSSIDWKGLIFTWSLAPNEDVLFDNGVSVYAVSPFRNYLMSDQVITPISLENIESVNDQEIIREFISTSNKGFSHRDIVHLGKRSNSAKYLKNIIEGSNVQWFKNQYSEENWNDVIKSSRKTAYKKAFDQFKNSSNVRGAREEMERILSAKVANSEFFEMKDSSIDELKKDYELILEAIQHPKIILDSVAYVWMVKQNNE